ncbi:MAG: molecular chaperone GrpE [Nocardioidaceae bacterium]|nr:molecular chaperone GrpE [Nocardioidaceae bacterium]
MTRKQPEGEPAAAPPEAGSFGDAAGEMANETEVEEVTPGKRRRVSDRDDISGVDNMVEEGAPLEPADIADEQGDPVARADQALAERTADLQRLQAEYLNYKRRVDRDRELVRENATYAALAPIVEVLDTIVRAREHGELDAGLQAVSDQLERAVAGAGLVRYGEPGDAFDPRLHEALSHIGEDPDVEVTTAKVIAKVGYRIGDRVVRAAQVLVVDPARA